MARHPIFVSLMGLCLANFTEAKCVQHPEIRATVTVEACVGASFAASHSKIQVGAGEPWALYKEGDSISGTLITVSVQASHFVWTNSSERSTNGWQNWSKGQLRSLFVRAPSVEVCPKVLPATVAVQTEQICCDSSGWECLLPRTVALVNIVRTQ